ncbi:MAG: diol dehydratase reactivase subunit alpha [Firmicutes bacterium]|nr:diol dehydratase reactivase subunit alpha [Bacillota bacterium]
MKEYKTKPALPQYVAGIDIGNSTTEVALAHLEQGLPESWWSACVPTTGVKGTKENIKGLFQALDEVVRRAGLTREDIHLALLNDATPVIGDLAMSTISETIITDSAMIGHNPGTPGGSGLGIGRTKPISDLKDCGRGEQIIALVDESYGFHQAALLINQALEQGVEVNGIIAQKDDGVLIANRLTKKLPVVDEVRGIEAVPLDMPAAVEVAEAGYTISKLCNPYGISSIFGLSSKETRSVANIAITLIGNRSAVVIKTPAGMIEEYRVPIGSLYIESGPTEKEVDISLGAEKIMAAVDGCRQITDIRGEACTSVGGMLGRIKQCLSDSSGQSFDQIKVRDLLAVDTIVSQPVKGAVAGETCTNRAVGLAAMVYTDRMLMKDLLTELQQEVPFPVSIGGVEVEMAVRGALTTPGTQQPLVVLDMGSGSVDAALWEAGKEIRGIHLAGAGEMVTRMIDTELDLKNRDTAELVKRYPAVFVDSLFHYTMENGQMVFPKEPAPLPALGRTALLMENGVLYPLEQQISLEKLVRVRRECKSKVLLTNALRALKKIAPGGNIRLFEHVALIGGCAMDFEVSQLISEYMLHHYGVVCGAGNIRGCLGPRGAVAVGLVKHYLETAGVEGE